MEKSPSEMGWVTSTPWRWNTEISVKASKNSKAVIKNDEWMRLSYYHQIYFKGDVYPEIQEKTNVEKYNFQLKMVYTEGMGEGWEEMVKTLFLNSRACQ